MEKAQQQEVSTITLSKEARRARKLGEPSKWLWLQKTGLIVFAILAAGLIELLINLAFLKG